MPYSTCYCVHSEEVRRSRVSCDSFGVDPSAAGIDVKGLTSAAGIDANTLAL